MLGVVLAEVSSGCAGTRFAEYKIIPTRTNERILNETIGWHLCWLAFYIKFRVIKLVEQNFIICHSFFGYNERNSCFRLSYFEANNDKLGCVKQTFSIKPFQS